ncbi:fumarylacetoacetate hydrolase family protein [Mesorhizobium marinum]|uniref:Fumarylacetoacetate hydrolase family protein n=1 Tax=Mesorhizobium marinum TaxID=3228790 RepID=A0ABV3QXI7_9HYPH
MKLLRYGEPGLEKPGLLDAAGSIRDLSGIVPDIAGDTLSPDGLARLAAIDPATLPRAEGSPRLGPAVMPTRNFVCVGLNYADHAAETGSPIPKEPILFLKSLSAVCGPDDDTIIPPGATRMDWEVELGIVIGSLARRVPKERAFEHVAGYTLINDVSEREWQSHRGGVWDKGKGFETFGPIGPWLVTRDEVADPQALRMFADVDGKRYQDGSTRTMIFDVATLVEYVSFCFTLHPGDVIATGTPPGVGLGQKPDPVFLREGQVVKLGIEGLGEQTHRMVGAR